MSAQENLDQLISIRRAQPDDRPQVERLISEGLLPGHVDYESARAEEIRRSFGSKRERFLVAVAEGRVIGALALIEASRDVGHLHWLRVDPAWQSDLAVARRLIRAAAAHAREVGFLKLAMHAPADRAERVASYYHLLGFEFSRARDVDGVHVMEFYLNLYERPPIQER